MAVVLRVVVVVVVKKKVTRRFRLFRRGWFLEGLGGRGGGGGGGSSRARKAVVFPERKSVFVGTKRKGKKSKYKNLRTQIWNMRH